MPLPTNRKIWTALPGDTSINNFNSNNVSQIRNLLNLQGNVINEYHRKTTGSFPSRLTRCSSKALDGTIGDEDVGLINFVRGEDYFDYDADCVLNEKRTRVEKSGKEIDAYLADIYNSTLLIVGPPKASMSTSSQLTEAHFRKMKKYRILLTTIQIEKRLYMEQPIMEFFMHLTHQLEKRYGDLFHH